MLTINLLNAAEEYCKLNECISCDFGGSVPCPCELIIAVGKAQLVKGD